jgi:DNA-binding MarR family transcriptional regulator
MTAQARMIEDKHGGAPLAKDSLRLWLKLLTCTSVIEKRVRGRLRERFATTLPRFDLLATLDHASEPLTMGQLSSRLLVSNGNVTGLVARLEAEGHLTRIADPADRRTFYVTLTAKGQNAFNKMAITHEGWIEEMFQSLEAGEIAAIMDGLERLKWALAKHSQGDAR